MKNTLLDTDASKTVTFNQHLTAQ